MSHTVSPVLILIPVLIVLFLVGGLAAIIALIANRKTRVVGIILLVAAPMALLVLAGLGWFVASDVQIEPTRQVQHATATEKPRTVVEEANNLPAKKGTAKPPALAAKTPVEATAGEGEVLVNAEGKPAAKPAKKPPAWVETPPKRVGDSYQMAIVVGPYTTRQECDEQLHDEMLKALNRYVETCLGERPVTGVVVPYYFLRGQVIKDQWEEVRQYSVGPMTRLHVLLQFDRKVKDRILEAHREAVVAGRLWVAGEGVLAGLGLLALIYGYLRITADRGQRSGARD